MTIVKYEVIRRITDKDMPYLQKGHIIIIPNIRKKYKYYLEVRRYNTTIKDYEYFLLLGEDKFDINCNTCKIDKLGRLVIYCSNELRDIMLKVINTDTTFNFEYYESENEYDVWQIS